MRSEQRGDSLGEGGARERGRKLWRSLPVLSKTQSPEGRSEREFAPHAALLENALDRRDFLKMMAASLAFGGLTACGARMPVERIVPYVRQPEGITYGQPLFYATAMTLQGYALGLLAESHEGRPTKIEGNPDHPASLGATDVFAQASVLTLYDPDRAQSVTHLGEISSWGEFLKEFGQSLARLRASQGTGLRVLTETITSPTLAAQLEGLQRDFPQAVWHQYEPCNGDNAREGARMAFGDYVETVYRFDRADVILALDADFLTSHPASVRYARDFITKRRVRASDATMNRLYVVESAPSPTGAMADHRLPLKAREIENFARAIAASLGIQLGEQSTNPLVPIHNPPWLAALARDLQAHRGAGLVIAGADQPPVVHALAHAMNGALGSVGNTVVYTAPVEARPVNQLESLRQLVRDMDAGAVELLVILNGNPAYYAPADFHFAASMAKVPLRVHHSLYYDESSALCHWHIPETHYLESWGDARAYDGTATIIQPLIAPLYEGKSAHELLAAFTDNPERSAYDIVREYWTKQSPSGPAMGGRQNANAPQRAATGSRANANDASTPSAPTANSNNAETANSQTAQTTTNSNAIGVVNEFERFWQQSLRDGFVQNTAFQPQPVTLKTDWLNQVANLSDSNIQTPISSLEIVFRPDPCTFDGRFANNGWLQELPKPLTKLTWGNAALISPATARRFGLTEELARRGGAHGQIIVDVVELNYRGQKLRAPALIVPGHADDSVTIHLGYGRERAGQVGSGVGFNAYQFRASDALYFGAGLELHKTGETSSLACTQQHHSMEGRDPVRFASLEEFRAHPDFAQREADDPRNAISLYPGWKYEGHAWGMVVDTGSCTGCNACVIACQAENNIPVVGREEVMHGREMHWIRIDRYYAGGEANPQTLKQPVMCQHCENAPCELVCPVEATTHSPEGLNEMTYNRCVGTRYCSNNCPYKVRRFNFFQYADDETPVVQLQRNPNVTVRSRGVMEKCTYCVQRIQSAKVEAEKEGRPLRDGEILTACQQACPTEAIVFGDTNDPNSKVSRLKRAATNYGLLAELNTRPRTTYLATVFNPNPEIEAE